MNGEAALKLKDLGVSGGMDKVTASMALAVPKAKAKGKKPKNVDGNPNTQEVIPETPLEKAITLVNGMLKEANSCRDNAFKIRPLEMSEELQQQLECLDAKFQDCAERIQVLIGAKKNKDSDYAALIAEAGYDNNFLVFSNPCRARRLRSKRRPRRGWSLLKP